jgi:pantetheine-phosphate adenylyltransferase
MKKCICSGSYDPITIGHLDIIRRATLLFDEVVVAVLDNPNKKAMFSIDTRKQMIAEAVANMPSVKVVHFSGLLADIANAEKADCIVRGLRNSVDYEYEKQMAQVNSRLASNIETIFIPTDFKYMHISSSIVKELAHLGADISEYVPECVIKYFEK